MKLNDQTQSVMHIIGLEGARTCNPLEEINSVIYVLYIFRNFLYYKEIN